MTYEDAYREANRFQFDPDTQVVCDRRCKEEKYIDLGLRHMCCYVDVDRRNWLWNTEIVELAYLTTRHIQNVLEHRWVAFAHHELQEWLTKDGRPLYDPHGVRNLQA